MEVNCSPQVRLEGPTNARNRAMLLSGLVTPSGQKKMTAATAVLVLILGVAVAALITTASSAFTTGQSASLVLGQTGFTSGGSATSATGLWGPKDEAFDASGNLWVSDSSNNRVVEYLKGTGFSTGQSASIVMGQTQYNQGNVGNLANGLTTPVGIAFDSSGDLWVADSGNNRILEFPAPLTSGESASLVLGQADFGHASASTTASGLSSPQGLAFDSAGNLWLADQKNNRVLEYASPFTSGESASLVIGQSGFQQATGTTTASGLVGPTGLAFDGSGNLWVVDQGNDRVLEYNRPLSTGESASVALGQTTLSSANSGTSASGMWNPVRVLLDSSGNAWVSESTNNRVLEFSPPFATGMLASLVIGQGGFTSANAATSPTGLQTPAGLAFASGNLWVADSGNNRVLEYSAPPQTSTTSTASTSTATITSTVFTTITTTATVSTTATTTATFSSTLTSTAVVTSTVVATSTATSTATNTVTLTTTQTSTSSSTYVSTSTQTVSSTVTATQTLTVTSTYAQTTTASPTTSSAAASTGGSGCSGPNCPSSSWLGWAVGIVVVALVVLLAILFTAKRTRLLRRGGQPQRPSSWA